MTFQIDSPLWKKPFENKNVEFFLLWFGLTIFVLGRAIIFENEGSIINLFFNGLQLIGLLILFPSLALLLSWNLKSVYLDFFFLLLLLWTLGILLRGLQFDFHFFKSNLVEIFQNFVPLFLLIPKTKIFIRGLFNAISLHGIIFLIYCIIFFSQISNAGSREAQFAIESFSHFLAIPSGFILLSQVYHTPKKNILALSVILICFVFAAFNGRRGLTFISASFLVSAYFVFVVSNKGKILKIIISIFMIIFLFFYGREIYLDNQRDFFKELTERLYEKNRSGVEDCLYEDLGTVDWVIGRGVNGKYYCPGIEKGEFSVFRNGIETGYLHIILKGGLISLGIFLLIMVPAVFKGLFFSKNWLAKSSAIYILLSLVFSFPTIINTFSLKYIIMWLAASICFDPNIRHISDEEIKNNYFY
jgi:hypothetical protein